jgi:hypothetical protein
VDTGATKFCKHCGEKIHIDAVICSKCGLQVEELKGSQTQPTIIVNNQNNVNGSGQSSTQKSKITALLLCFFLGVLGAHKFYEGKIGLGVLYFFTWGLFGIGVLIDFITLIFKPDPYYV